MATAARIIRLITLLILLAAIVTAAVLLCTTERGHALLMHPHDAGRDVQQWVGTHRLIAPLAFMGFYILLILLMLPVWWMQILAGYGFGLVMGVLWCQIAATIGSTAGLLVSRFIAAEWFHEKVEARLERIRALDDKLGHNGLLVVMAVRLMHFVPIGLSNYVFGLTTITALDVAVGTLTGGIPAVSAYVGAGAGYHPWSNWRFISALLLINGLLLVPLALRYIKPEWFKKMGIE